MTDKRILDMKRQTSKQLALFLLATLSVLFLTACESGKPMPDPGLSRAAMPANIPTANIMPTIFQVAQGLAIQIRQNLREQDLQAWPCIVTSFADIDNLESSSRFGRLLAEAVSSELFRQGAVIRELRSAHAVFVQPRTGELILSRDAKTLADAMDARAVIAGTYGKGASSVAVNLKMIDLRTRAVVSVAMTELARTASIEALLREPETRKTAQAPPPTSYDIQTF